MNAPPTKKRMPVGLQGWNAGQEDPQEPGQRPTAPTTEEVPADDTHSLSQEDRSNQPVMSKEPVIGYKLALEWNWMNTMPWKWIFKTAKLRIQEEFQRVRQADPSQPEEILWRSLASTHAERWAAEYMRKNNVTVPEKTRQRLTQVLVDELYGIGARLEPLIKSSKYTDIIVQGNQNSILRPRTGGPPLIGPRVWDTESEMVETINDIASSQNREFSFTTPKFDGRTVGGERVHAVRDLSEHVRLTIRCHDMGLSNLEELQNRNTIDPVLSKLLRAAVQGRCNLIVSGATGTGKTTLLRAMINEIPPDENIFTVEDSPELGIFESFGNLHPCGTAMIARQANLEGKGAVTMDDLVKETLRMTPDRVIVGEVRGREALSMIMAMSQGNDGSMCSLHSNSALDSLSRLQVYISQHPDRPGTRETQMLIGKAVDLIIHVQRRGNRRTVSEILEVSDFQEGQIATTYLYVDKDGVATKDGSCTMTTKTQMKLAREGFTHTDYMQPLRWAPTR